MTQDNLENRILLTVEYDINNNLFYDDVIDEFVKEHKNIMG